VGAEHRYPPFGCGGVGDMGAVRMLAGFEIRRRWRRVVLLTLLVGVIGAVVLATVAGARRTSTALNRFTASSRTASLELQVGDATPAELRAFEHAPGVAAIAPLRSLALEVSDAPQLTAIASALDTRFNTTVDRPRVVAGRAANPNAAGEVMIGETLAAQLHLRVGDDLVAETLTPAQVATCFAGGCSGTGPAPRGPRVRLRLVGIVRRPLDLGDRGATGGVLVLTPGFTRRYENAIGSWSGQVVRVRTEHGESDVAEVAAEARKVFGAAPEFAVTDLAVDTQGAKNAIDVLTVALWVFAGVAALAGLVAIVIILGREISLTATDQGTQSALGLTRRQRLGVGTLHVLPVAFGGALVAAVVAAAASPLFPIGVARRAEPDPGLRIDGGVLALGVLAIAAVVIVIAFAATLRSTRSHRVENPAPGAFAAALGAATRTGLSPVATNGVRMAVEPGRGSSTVPVRSAMFGAVFGVLGVVAVLIFASSLDHLAANPARYGWTWGFAAVPDAPAVVGTHSPLLQVPGIAAAEEADTAPIQVDGHGVGAWGFRPIRGAVGPAIVAGRAPRGADEVALGAATLDELGKGIGDTVHAEGPDGHHGYTIVGKAVFPQLDGPQPLANGAAFASEGLAAILSPTNNHDGTPFVLVRVARGASVAAVERRVAAIPMLERPFGPTVPVEVDRIRKVGWLPVTLAALLAGLALLAVGHALVTSVRRRRHDLAIFKTLGFDRRQVRTTVAWQASTLAVIGLVVGIPVGIVVGSFVWREVASGLGVATTSDVPTLALLLVIPCAVAAVNLLAFFPARAAARTRPAVALRTE
jgi:putative ABC transport system permease protein